VPKARNVPFNKDKHEYRMVKPIIFYEVNQMDLNALSVFHQNNWCTPDRFASLGLVIPEDAKPISSLKATSHIAAPGLDVFGEGNPISYEDVCRYGPFAVAYIDMRIARAMRGQSKELVKTFVGKRDFIRKWAFGIMTSTAGPEHHDALDLWFNNLRGAFNKNETLAINQCFYGFNLALCANRRKRETLGDFEKRTERSRNHYFGKDKAPMVWEAYKNSSSCDRFEGRKTSTPSGFSIKVTKATASRLSKIGSGTASRAADIASYLREVYTADSKGRNAANANLSPGEADLLNKSRTRWNWRKVYSWLPFVSAPKIDPATTAAAEQIDASLKGKKKWFGGLRRKISNFFTFSHKKVRIEINETQEVVVPVLFRDSKWNPLNWIYKLVPTKARVELAGNDTIPVTEKPEAGPSKKGDVPPPPSKDGGAE